MMDEPEISLNNLKSVHERNVVFPGFSPSDVGSGLVFDSQVTCAIDAANRCAQSKFSVNEYLTEIYGPADFANPAPKPGTIILGGGDEIFQAPQGDDNNKNRHHSPGTNVDHHNLNTGAAIGLAIGVVAFFFVLFAVIVVCAGLFSRAKDGKIGTGGSKDDEVDEH